VHAGTIFWTIVSLLSRRERRGCPENIVEILGRIFYQHFSKIAEAKERKMDIKVLGPGCPKCRQTEKIVKEAVAESGVDAQVDKVTDAMEIAGYGVFGTPAVVIDGDVKSVGKIPQKKDVKAWLGK
jgi:small redox-active disulfide protein 2